MTPADVAEFLKKHREFEGLIASHNWWLSLFTIIVAAGIFFEIAVEFVFSRDRPRIEKIAVTICGLIVLGGVIGEYIEGTNVADAANHLQKIADSDVGRLYKEASDANARAGKAEKVASESNERAANADQKTEQERLARVQLEQKLAFRHLNPEQAASLKTQIAPLAGKQVKIFAQSRDFEASMFAGQLREILRSAGIDATLGLGDQFGIAYTGVIIETTIHPESTRVAGLLLAALTSKSVGVVAAVATHTPESGQTPSVRIAVGSKPETNEVELLQADP
jgi:hypothetical protein